MKIVILGAGTVGTAIADLLCQNGHSVTVVDADGDCVKKINDMLDVRAIKGSASQSSVLFQANANSCDLCIAVTGVDEVNLIGASIAKRMGAHRCVARVYSPVFHDLSTFDYQRSFQIDRFLSLEQLTALELAREIRSRNSAIVDYFATGDIEIQEVEVTNEQAHGKALKDLGLPSNIRIGSISREQRTWVATATDKLETGDSLDIVGKPEDIERIKTVFQTQETGTQFVVIAGGGETGYHLANMLENGSFSIVLMESSASRCEWLANSLRNVTVLHCDATQRMIMEEERVGDADFFVACTGDDENNIMAGVEAKEVGAKRCFSVVGRPDYGNVVGKIGIDFAVSERQVMAKQILGLLNGQNVISRYVMPNGRIGIYEIEVEPDSPAVTMNLADLPLPDPCLIAAMMRDRYSRVPEAGDRLQTGDLVVVFMDESVVAQTIPFFQTSTTGKSS
ncbi:MAG: Trk system potassium transporter TrkA [Pirellulaceae bacterium]|jgi:trk system potassium uptake protein|nr:Trk system potassium transporter TrkA [Mariniblastus sp.]MDB4756045.1 Trk system potassium transporter TrkA [Mariniblastus sp.]MDG2470054.1 Trk system potassium transporter TrkA [Pirellulaceae bacterium]